VSGFRTVGDFANADLLGQCWLTQFRKVVASAATIAGQWIDYSYYAGSPAANFYASSPLVAAEVDPSRGIYVPSVTPMTQHLKSLNVMIPSSTGNAASARQRLMLADYLLYYPFIDTDAIGLDQALDNTVVIPRYPYGRVIAVAQSAAGAVGDFTFTYTNQTGVSGRVSPVQRTVWVNGGGHCLSTVTTGGAYFPFLPLATGDYGVKSIESVNFSASGGGLMALVIVKPLFHAYATQECRTTSGVAFGAADEFVSVINSAGAPRILDGAVLNFFSQGTAGSLANNLLIGTLETVWN